MKKALPRVRAFAAGFFACLQVNKFSLALDRFVPYPHVQPDHDHDRDVKGEEDGDDGHVLVGVNKLHVAVVLGHRPTLDIGPA